MNERIYLSSPDIGELEQEAVLSAMRSGWIAPLGPDVDAFEVELANYTGRAHAVALSSGTAALHLGLLALGVGPGDVVLTSSLTFAATANAITYTGAQPVFIDADSTGNLNPDILDEAFSYYRKLGRQVKAVVPVDLLGKVVDHERIGEVSARHGAIVLSDAAESLGATRSGRSAAAYGNAAAVSFNGNKIMTTSGGGALLTDCARTADYVRYLATQARQPVVHYEHTEVGFNYRLSNLLAALGRAQLSRLDSMIAKRKQIRELYSRVFQDVSGISIFGDDNHSEDVSTADNYWLTSILVDPILAGFSTEDLRLALFDSKIESRPLWKPMHLQPVYSTHQSFIDGTSEKLFRTGLSLPSGSVLSDKQLDRVTNTLSNFLHNR